MNPSLTPEDKEHREDAMALLMASRQFFLLYNEDCIDTDLGDEGETLYMSGWEVDMDYDTLVGALVGVMKEEAWFRAVIADAAETVFGITIETGEVES